jgi:hypothetical protein
MSVEGFLGSTDEYLRLEEEVSVQHESEDEGEEDEEARDKDDGKQEVTRESLRDGNVQFQGLEKEFRDEGKDPMEDEDVDLLSHQIDEIASIMKQSVVVWKCILGIHILTFHYIP